MAREFELDPELFFVIFLPPLLFADGWQMPIREFKKFQGDVLSLALGLVVFTTFLIGLVVKALIPELPWGMAFAVGALVSPTDAVAVSAITRKLKLPNKLSTIINGESLVNDASGLVAFRFAVLAAAAGTLSFQSVLGSFFLLAVGGSVLGLALSYGMGKIRDGLRRFHSADPQIETTLSLITPFAGYFLATALDVSPILTVVVAGLYSGWRDPIKMNVETRQTAWSVWLTILFWLNGLAFLLLGLTGKSVWIQASEVFSLFELIIYPLIVTGVTIGARLTWFYGSHYLLYFLSGSLGKPREKPDPKLLFILCWSGIRGAVTLAAALSIPLATSENLPFPGRIEVVFLSLGVVAVTLVLHGLTLGPLIKGMQLPPEDGTEKESQLARIAAVEAGLRALQEVDLDTLKDPGKAALKEAIADYEHRLAVLTNDGEARTFSEERICASRTFELKAVLAERDALDRLWLKGTIND